MTLPKAWRESPEIISDFLAKRADHEQMANEVAYILKNRLKKIDIRYASIAHRPKTLESFLEKLERKKYGENINKITDFAGARVVCLYPGDLPRIEGIIREEFEVLEKVDKVQEQGVDRFGYGAIHFLVKLGKRSSGARYDDLKELICEIQTRTVLQDAWAIIDQHLFYKREDAIPSELRRKLHGLAGLFETADDQFEAIRRQRDDYLARLEGTKAGAEFLEQELNLDSLRAFCTRTFPDRRQEEDTEFPRVLTWLMSQGYRMLQDLDVAVEKSRSALLALMAEIQENEEIWTDLFCLHVSVALASERYREAAGFAAQLRAAIKAHAVK